MIEGFRASGDTLMVAKGNIIVMLGEDGSHSGRVMRGEDGCIASLVIRQEDPCQGEFSDVA
jgi:hypothetical protein